MRWRVRWCGGVGDVEGGEKIFSLSLAHTRVQESKGEGL